jgi:hypothetical protein
LRHGSQRGGRRRRCATKGARQGTYRTTKGKSVSCSEVWTVHPYHL